MGNLHSAISSYKFNQISLARFFCFGDFRLVSDAMLFLSLNADRCKLTAYFTQSLKLKA
jgi:hypothetical protein